MSRISSCFLINVKEADSVSGYSVKSPTKKIKAVFISVGIYLCFIDEKLLNKDIEEQFCEVLYKDELIIIRYKDIIKLIV